MHSLETGIILSIAAFFSFSFLTFVFLRENNISKEILQKVDNEKKNYVESSNKDYNPELYNNIINIIIEEGKLYDREDK